MRQSGHVLIAGQTMSGKTILARCYLAPGYLQRGWGVLVHDKNLSEWGQSKSDRVKVTDDSELFLRWIKEARRCAVFVDEASEVCNRYKENIEFSFLGTQARHWGHRSHFICQGITQIMPTIRAQCTDHYLFRLTKAEAQKMFKESGEEYHLETSSLPMGHFIHTAPFAEPTRARVAIPPPY